MLRRDLRTLRPRLPAPNRTTRFLQAASNLPKAEFSRSRTLLIGSLSTRSSSARYWSVFVLVAVIRSPALRSYSGRTLRDRGRARDPPAAWKETSHRRAEQKLRAEPCS